MTTPSNDRSPNNTKNAAISPLFLCLNLVSFLPRHWSSFSLEGGSDGGLPQWGHGQVHPPADAEEQHQARGQGWDLLLLSCNFLSQVICFGQLLGMCDNLSFPLGKTNLTGATFLNLFSNFLRPGRFQRVQVCPIRTGQRSASLPVQVARRVCSIDFQTKLLIAQASPREQGDPWEAWKGEDFAEAGAQRPGWSPVISIIITKGPMRR